MARPTPLRTGIRSAPTTEMYTRWGAPARDAARTRFLALSSSPLELPAQCTMISAPPLHRGFDPLAGGQVTAHELDAGLCLTAAAAEHPYIATGVPQEPDDESSERTGAARNQDG